MRNRRRRPARPGVNPLEDRQLLTATNLTAQWIGQDGHDLVGYSSTSGGNGYQDIHIALGGLDPARTITRADVEGLGGGQWLLGGPASSWLADIVRTPSATTADLYIEPYQQDSGRPYNVALTFDNGSTANVWVNGGPVNPNLPAAALAALWLATDGTDRVNPSPSVGPDGVADQRIGLTGLSTTATIASVTVNGNDGLTWRSGSGSGGFLDLETAVSPTDATQATLFLATRAGFASQTLTVNVAYTNGKMASATVPATPNTNPTAPTATPSVPIQFSGLSVAWMGQDGQDGPGNVHLAIWGLPRGRTVVAAAISDESGNAWQYQSANASGFVADPNAWSLDFRQGIGSTTAEFFLPPARDETGAILTARLLLDDGSTEVVTFAGQSADLTLRSPRPSNTAITAHPGDDLNALANAFGSVHLAAGTYPLSQPLVLNHPVTITADPGATLLFTQQAGSAPWTTAIKIHAGNTTLDGFAVRFATSVAWSSTVSYGPAVIGTTDDQDGPGFNDPMAGLTLTHLDLQSPPAATSWEEAPGLLRLVSAANGVVSDDVLKGGTTQVHGGPWTMTGNTYLGTVPGTYSYAAFAGHSTHDLTLSHNVANPVGDSGKTWRFLVLTQSGIGDLVAGNSVSGIGPRDDDTVPSTNAPEIILSEAYQLHFEGMPTAISQDGRILQISTPQGGMARTGDVVAILSGPDAGQYRRISQAIDSRTYLMSDPLPAGSYAISIATGFVDETYRENIVDARGSSVAAPLVLAGTQFGTQVVGNVFLGGSAGFTIQATPTEQPVTWGWSHTPVFGLNVADNLLVDATVGGNLSIGEDPSARADDGRVYFSGTLTGNVVEWTADGLAARSTASAPLAFVVGDPNAINPVDFLLSQSGNRLNLPAGTSAPPDVFRVNSATIEGVAISGGSLPLPTAGPSVSDPVLVEDTGVSDFDGLTSDGRLVFASVPGGVGYAYRLANATEFVPTTPDTPFLPVGLVQGANSVIVHAFDASGRAGPDASVTFTLDTIAPNPSAPTLAPGSDSGASAVDGLTNNASPTWLVSGDSNDAFALLRGGMVVATRQGPGPLQDPTVLADGVYTYQTREIDPAGNIGTSSAVAVTILTNPPPAPYVLTTLGGGWVQLIESVSGVILEYQVNGTGPFVLVGTATTFLPAGLDSGVDNRLSVRAVDLAGNVGLAQTVVIPAESTTISSSPTQPASASPVSTLLSGPPVTSIHLVGLSPRWTVVSVSVGEVGRGVGRSSVQAQLVRASGSSTAEVDWLGKAPVAGRRLVLALRLVGGRTVILPVGQFPPLAVRLAGGRPRAFLEMDQTRIPVAPTAWQTAHEKASARSSWGSGRLRLR